MKKAHAAGRPYALMRASVEITQILRQRTYRTPSCSPQGLFHEQAGLLALASSSACVLPSRWPVELVASELFHYSGGTAPASHRTSLLSRFIGRWICTCSHTIS